MARWERKTEPATELKCRLCGDEIKESSCYRFFAFYYHNNCWELKIIRELRDESWKQRVKRLDYKKQDKLSKKERET